MSTIPPNERNQSKPRAVTPRGRTGGVGGLLEPMILTWHLFWDARVSVAPKLIPLAAVIYLVSPVDFIPELAVPLAGLVDDVGILILAMNGFVALCPPDVVQEHRLQLGYATDAKSDSDADVVDGHATPMDER